MSPPCISTACRTSARPTPSSALLGREVEVADLRRGSPAGSPGPCPRPETRISCSALRLDSTILPPREGSAWVALVIRFCTAWRSTSASPRSRRQVRVEVEVELEPREVGRRLHRLVDLEQEIVHRRGANEGWRSRATFRNPLTARCSRWISSITIRTRRSTSSAVRSPAPRSSSSSREIVCRGLRISCATPGGHLSQPREHARVVDERVQLLEGGRFLELDEDAARCYRRRPRSGVRSPRRSSRPAAGEAGSRGSPSLRAHALRTSRRTGCPSGKQVVEPSCPGPVAMSSRG